MSQHNSSMISSGIPNSEVKYQKALKQISKLINTNKILKNECEQRQQILGAQLSDVAMRFEQLSKKHDQVEQQKRRMQEFMEQLQDTYQDLRKQYQTLERQVGYLNDVLIEQNAQLKKLSVFKDQKGISQLFRSYQQRQDSYKKDVSRLEQNISNLKTIIDRSEEDLTQQTEMRKRYEDQYNMVGLQINKYRDLNNYLINQNQIILNGVSKDSGYNKHQELQSFVFEFRKQLQTLRSIKYQAQDVSERQYAKNFQTLLEEKNGIAIQLAKTRDRLQVSQSKIQEMYEFEQKMSTAQVRSDVLIEENNMLKNRITILQSKEIIDSAGFEQDSELKDFEDKINFMMSKADPLTTIKNGDDNNHFVTMKSFITDLQLKLQLAIQQKQVTQRKYKNLKMKFNKKAEQSIILEDSNQLLKGKLQGYERLTEKLHYELQRSMNAHEDQIIKMVAITNNLVGKKVQESKSASVFIKSQFDTQLQKAQRAQKSLSQQLQTLKIQNSTLKIKLTDVQQKLSQSSQFIDIYQNKLQQITMRYKQLETQNTNINQDVIRYEQLYREEKIRYETVLVQKQNLGGKISLLSEQLSQRTYGWDEKLNQNEENHAVEVRRLKVDVQRYRDQLQNIRNQTQRVSSELDQRKIKQGAALTNFKNQNHYYSELQKNYNELKHAHNSLENQLISSKHRMANFDNISKQLSQFQSQVMRKSDELNDEKRAAINLRKQIESLQLQNSDLREHNSQLGQEISALKQKLYQQPTQASGRDSFSSVRQSQSRKAIQRLNEQIAILQSSVRDQKRSSTRIITQVQSYKQEIERLEGIISRNKSREQSLLATISQVNEEICQIQDQLYEHRSRYSQTSITLQNLNQTLEQNNLKIAQLTEQLAATRTKLSRTQSKHQNLIRDLNGTKHYIQEAQKMTKRLNSAQRLQWQQQAQKENISSLIDCLKRIIRNNETVQVQNSGSNHQYSFIPSSSFGNIDSNYMGYNPTDDYTNISFKGSFGKQEQSRNNIVTNDSLRVLQVSSSFDAEPRMNFSRDTFSGGYQVGLVSTPYRQFDQI